MGRKRKFYADKETLYGLRQHYTIVEIAKMYDVDPRLVTRYLTKFGLTNKVIKPPEAELVEMRKKSTIQEVADFYNVCFDTARTWTLGMENAKISKISKPSKIDLEERYKNYNIKQISKYYGTSTHAVSSWLRYYEISTDLRFALPPKEELEMYCKTKRVSEIAQIYGVCAALIVKWCKEYNLPKNLIRYNNALPESLTEKQEAIVEGLLLSDGSLFGIKENTNSSFVVAQCYARCEFVKWVCEQLHPFGSDVKLHTQIRPSHDETGRIYIDKTSTNFIQKSVFCTYKHPCFTALRKRWYPNNVKIVPDNFVLSPLSLTMWYVGDGQNVSTRNSAVFHTQGFSEKDCLYLIDQLLKLKIESLLSYEKNKPIIRVRTNSYLNLIEIVKPFITWDCFKYKIDLSKCKMVKQGFNF